MSNSVESDLLHNYTILPRVQRPLARSAMLSFPTAAGRPAVPWRSRAGPRQPSAATGLCWILAEPQVLAALFMLAGELLPSKSEWIVLGWGRCVYCDRQRMAG